MKKIITSLSCVLIFNLYAENEVIKITDKNFSVSIPWLEKKPTSYAKDFFIIQFLKQKNTSVEDAKLAYSMAKRQKGRLLRAFNKKINLEVPNENSKCYTMDILDLVKEKESCITLGLKLSKTKKLTQTQIKKLISKIKNNPILKNDLKIIISKLPFSELMKKDVEGFYRLFFSIDKNFRVNKLNYPIPQSFIDKISKDKKFNKFVKLITSNDNLRNIQESLLKVKDNKNISHRSLFNLAINALKHNEEKYSLNYLDSAYKKAYFQKDKDKVLFWNYLITNKTSLLKKVSESYNNNIYSLYAKELLAKKSDNIIYNIDILNKKSDFNTLDHFDWINILSDVKLKLDEDELNKYYKLFSDKTTLAHYTYILAKFYKYKKEYYITPYKDSLSKYSINRQVLMYSIGRQESRFLPAAVSFATAQGVMQIMPFLSKSIAKKIKEPYNIYEQFTPKVNLKYANIHLNSLSKQFNDNPLFIAYAYNGGAGYFRTQLRRGLFEKRGKYEPFLSMESISYPETRDYGKKVLANYYIYNNYLNKDNTIKLSTIFQSLIVPK